MKLSTKFFLMALGCTAISALAQYEDLSSLANIKSDEKSKFATLQTIKVSEKDGQKGVKETNIAFSFTGKPSVYFNYYDAQKKAVVFDFYDTHMSKTAVDAVHQAPITGSAVDSTQIDLNKDTKGLQADIRDVVRVTLYTPYNLEYEVQDAQGMVTLNYKWSGQKETELKRAKTAFYWQFPLGVAIVGGGGFAAYELFLNKDDKGAADVFAQLPAERPISP